MQDNDLGKGAMDKVFTRWQQAIKWLRFGGSGASDTPEMRVWLRTHLLAGKSNFSNKLKKP
jgi:hypothetical protein